MCILLNLITKSIKIKYNEHYTYLNNRTDLEVVLCILTGNSTGGVGEQKTNKSTQHWKVTKTCIKLNNNDKIYLLINPPSPRFLNISKDFLNSNNR